MKCFISNSVLAAGLMLLSVASYGQTPITSVPYTISASGKYIFANNLTYFAATGNAITVNASHVSIDLNGYYLYNGPSIAIFGVNNARTAAGIYVNNGANVQVRNGAIGGFYYGVYFSGGFCHGVDGVRFWANSQDAVWFDGTRASIVQNCQIVGPGVNGVYFTRGTGNLAAHNVVSGLQNGFCSFTDADANNGTDYFDSNYADNCSEYGIVTNTPVTKYRFTTTTNCGTGVWAGTSEGASDN